MKTTAQKIEVMQAFLDGKKIEVKHNSCNSWSEIREPDFDWGHADYRVAEEPKKNVCWYCGKKQLIGDGITDDTEALQQMFSKGEEPKLVPSEQLNKIEEKVEEIKRLAEDILSMPYGKEA